MSGYRHPDYAASLAEFGQPRELPRSKGWLLQRKIPGSAYSDAMGCYPLFACRSWQDLVADIEDLEDELVSISLVTVPFGEFTPELLGDCFPDIAIPYKEHFVIDLSSPPAEIISRQHRRYARKGLDLLQVERCPNSPDLRQDWERLYSVLISRHSIEGISAFSHAAFEIQFSLPGFTAFRASLDNEPHGMTLWIRDDDVCYYHLGAYSQEGYESRASYALFWRAIEYFRDQGVRWICLGAGAGTKEDASDGLRRFKKGWATGTKTAYFCGRILNPRRYHELIEQGPRRDTEYFPAYRAPGFGEG